MLGCKWAELSISQGILDNKPDLADKQQVSVLGCKWAELSISQGILDH